MGLLVLAAVALLLGVVGPVDAQPPAFRWVADQTTGEWLSGGPYEPAVAAGQVVVPLARHPNLRTERHDGAGGIRPATPAEIAAWDQAHPDRRAVLRLRIDAALADPGTPPKVKDALQAIRELLAP